MLTEAIQLRHKNIIQELEIKATYTYLGKEEGDETELYWTNVRIKKEYKKRIKLAVKSELNARIKIPVINTLAGQLSPTTLEL